MTILDRIVDETRRLVATRRHTIPVSALEAMPLFRSPIRSLEQALRKERLTFIAEIKKASPSKGLIRADFDVRQIAASYAAAGAEALSVLTEPMFFQGALENLSIARDAAGDIPLLRKDFIVDEYQLFEAKAYGADAVLLIAAVLDRDRLRDLFEAAHGLGLEAIVELYDPDERTRIDLDRVRILGVNNRDLRTFAVDLSHAARLFATLPPHVVRVAESGIETADDLVFLRRHGADAVLIGESFMRAGDPGARLRELRDAIPDPRPSSSEPE
jgi:indole-3-glycerol phosphate synthase